MLDLVLLVLVCIYSQVECSRSEDRMRRISGRAFMLLQQVMDHLLLLLPLLLLAGTSTPPVPCCLLGYACCPVPGVRFTQDAPRTVLRAGLHHSRCLHQGGCNLIPFGSAREEEEGTALRSDALSSTPPLFLSLRLSLSSLICFIPRSPRKVAGAPASGTVISHCSPADQAPVRSPLTPLSF